MLYQEKERAISLVEAIQNLFQSFFTKEKKLDLSPAPAQGFPRKLWPILLIVSYPVLSFSLGNASFDHFLLFSLLLFFYYWRPETRRFLFFMLPLALVAIAYDSMKLYTPYIRGEINVKEPYLIELALFGIQTQTGALQTPNQILQNHTNWILDFLCGLSYLVFLAEYFIFCFYFYFAGLWRVARKAAWSFFLVNIMGYATYYIYPAAPPWYVEKYGLGPAITNVPASPAGTIRFDELLGTSFFVEMYSRAANVFGAIPSLHVSYPLLAVFYAFQIRRYQIFTIFFAILISFSAVYLNHHYIIDVILGHLYAVISFFCIEAFYKKRAVYPNKIV